MRVVLKKNKTFDNVDYFKGDEFILEGINWDDKDNEKYYILSKDRKKRHSEDKSLFDIDCRDIPRKT